MNDKNLFLIYLGRSGSGPRTTLDLSKEILKENNIKKLDLLISKQNSLLTKILDIKNDTYTIDTPISNLEAIFKIPYFIIKYIKILSKIKQNKTKNFFFVMTHIWNPICMLLIKIFIRKSNIFFTVHDAEIHPGDKNSKLQYLIMKSEIFLANKIVCPSENTKLKLLKKWKKDIWVVPLPVFNFGEIKNKRKLSSIPTFLFFGRIVKYKGLDLFLKALEVFDNYKNKPDYKVIIAGEGKIEDEEMDIIKKINKDKNIINLINKYIEEEDIESIWNMSDIAIISYVEASQSGIVALSINKAMPSIITPIKELIDQSEANNIDNSFVLISKDITPESFSERMLEMLNENIYEKLSQNAINMQKGTGFDKWVSVIVNNSI